MNAHNFLLSAPNWMILFLLLSGQDLLTKLRGNRNDYIFCNCGLPKRLYTKKKFGKYWRYEVCCCVYCYLCVYKVMLFPAATTNWSLAGNSEESRSLSWYVICVEPPPRSNAAIVSPPIRSRDKYQFIVIITKT